MPVVALAQQPADTLDLGQAVAYARVHNPRLAAAAADVAAAAARIAPAGTLPDPQLTVGAMNYMLPRLSAVADPLTMNQFTLNQTIPVTGVLSLRRSAARFDSTRAAYEREAVALEVERDVRAKYWEVYHDDRALELMGQTLTVLRELSRVAATMYAVGTAAQSDVIRSQVAITRLEQEITEMQLQRYAAAAQLNALLGRPGEVPVVLPTPAEHEAHGLLMRALDMPEVPPLDSLALEADSGNPEVRAERAAVGGAGANEAAVRRLIWPDLGLGVAYGQRSGGNDMVSAMVTVSLPVFAASRQLKLRDEARAMRQGEQERLAAVRLRVRSELATARAEAETARRLVGLYAGSLVPQGNASYQAALSGYRVGRVDFLTLLDAQTSLLDYEHDLHRYEAMYGTAAAELDRLVGRAYGAAGHEH